MAPVGPLFDMNSFAAPAEVEPVMTATSEVAAELEARTYGPAEVGGGKLLSVWPPPSRPAFVSVSAQSISAEATWVRVTAQGMAMDALSDGKEICRALEFRLGTMGAGALPPRRSGEYDRDTTRLLEAEIQELLERLASDRSAWESYSSAIYERELLLQHLTELGA